MSGFGHKLSEHPILEQKVAQLNSVRRRLAETRAQLQQVQDELSDIDSFYDRTLGQRLAELQSIEAEIAQLTVDGSGDGNDLDSAALAACRGWRSDARDIKTLYREVAKTVHPDLADATVSQDERTELMSRANRAYAEEDARTLEGILREWWRSRPGALEELRRLDRVIAAEKVELAELTARLAEVQGSLAVRLKLRLDGGVVSESLLADLVTAVDLNIDRGRRRLARLRGGEKAPGAQSRASRPWPGKTVVFPAGLGDGLAYLRERGSVNYSKWKKWGCAAGALPVPEGAEVRLDINGGKVGGLQSLSALRPDDLQALYLYGFSDADLPALARLTGVEELYLSGAGLTDQALSSIRPLVNLKRIYLYQTSISDRGLLALRDFPRLTGLTTSGSGITEAGLARLKLAVPGVKTVSFSWNR
ncbi:molecular chaperone DnaJ [Geomonas sp. Red32]|nr:molecular chaperone DnaJ [Geomonas sp. Red32]